MPAINVNPMRPAAWGPPDSTSSGGMNPPCGNFLRQFTAQKRRPRVAGPLWKRMLAEGKEG